MQRRQPMEYQLALFQKQLDWNEFPKDVRHRVCHLLAALCLEVIDNHSTTAKEHNHEPRDDSVEAS